MKFFPLMALMGLLITPFLAAGTADAQDSYSIRAGDILRIEVIEDPSLNRSVLVSPDGRISMPLAGALRASGKSIEDIQAELASGLAASFAARPNVYVAVERLAERRPIVRAAPAAPRAPTPAPTLEVFVMGEVGKPGTVTLDPGATVLHAFAKMGGFTRFAATSRVQLRRALDNGTEEVYTLDYKAIESGQSTGGMTVLNAGDVIMVPQRRLFE